MTLPAKKTSLSKSDEQEYAAFLRDIKLLALGLQTCNATINRNFYFELLEQKRSARRISTDYKLLQNEVEFFDVSAALTLTVEDEKEPSGAVLLVECKYEAHFHCAKCAKVHSSKEFAKRFAESELRLIMWPYFRQLINDITSRMAIQPILIPFSTAQSAQ
jgi:preprotein translocase subunit SecB